MGQYFPTGARLGFGLKAGRPRGEADENGAHLWRLASEKGSLLRWGHQAHSSPHSPDEVPSFSSVLAFFLGDGCAPAPHYSDPDPSVESTAPLTRSRRPLPPLEGSSGFGVFHVQLNLTSAPSETLRSQRKVFACLPFYRHISGRLYPSSHSPGPAWNTLPQAAHSKQPRFPGV